MCVNVPLYCWDPSQKKFIDILTPIQSHIRPDKSFAVKTPYVIKKFPMAQCYYTPPYWSVPPAQANKSPPQPPSPSPFQPPGTASAFQPPGAPAYPSPSYPGGPGSPSNFAAPPAAPPAAQPPSPYDDESGPYQPPISPPSSAPQASSPFADLY